MNPGNLAGMRAVVITEYGDVDVLQVQEVPAPVPGPDEVLVEVMASAMNRADLLQRAGQYPAPGPQPEYEVPGLEFSGTIAAVGSQVVSWSPGDAVMGKFPVGQWQKCLSLMNACFNQFLAALG